MWGCMQLYKPLCTYTIQIYISMVWNLCGAVGVYATVQTIVHMHHSNIYQHGLELFEWSVLCMLIFVVDILFSAFDV
jgi:hypothetical protein